MLLIGLRDYIIKTCFPIMEVHVHLDFYLHGLSSQPRFGLVYSVLRYMNVMAAPCFVKFTQTLKRVHFENFKETKSCNRLCHMVETSRDDKAIL